MPAMFTITSLSLFTFAVLDSVYGSNAFYTCLLLGCGDQYVFI
jgi:hypothetical protein